MLAFQDHRDIGIAVGVMRATCPAAIDDCACHVVATGDQREEAPDGFSVSWSRRITGCLHRKSAPFLPWAGKRS